MNLRLTVAPAALALGAGVALAQSVITFESPYTPGPIAGQQGWLNGGFETFGAVVSRDNPWSGLQHLRFGAAPDHTQQNLVSPMLHPPTGDRTVASLRFSIHQPDPQQGSDFMIYANGLGGTAWLLWFEAGGGLRVSDFMSDGGGIATFLADTPWTGDVYHEFRVDMRPSEGRALYSLDGELVHTGQLLQATSPLRLEIIRPAPLPGWADADFMDLDDLIVVPGPWTLALSLGLVGLRRRR